MKTALAKPFSLEFNGSNQYAIGTHGINGFDISAFQGKSAISVNVLVRTNKIINYLSSGNALFYLRNDASTHILTAGLGVYTNSFTDEYITMMKIGGFGGTSGVAKTSQSERIDPRFYMLTFIFSDTVEKGIYLDGVKLSGTISGNDFDGTADITPTVLLVGGAATPSNILNGLMRELSFFSRVLTQAEILTIYNFYGGSLDKISNSPASLRFHSLYSDASFIELYTGQRSGSTLLASKSTTRNLTLMNF